MQFVDRDVTKARFSNSTPKGTCPGSRLCDGKNDSRIKKVRGFEVDDFFVIATG
jgi:hypothetical protein